MSRTRYVVNADRCRAAGEGSGTRDGQGLDGVNLWRVKVSQFSGPVIPGRATFHDARFFLHEFPRERTLAARTRDSETNARRGIGK